MKEKYQKVVLEALDQYKDACDDDKQKEEMKLTVEAIEEFKKEQDIKKPKKVVK